MPEPFQRRGWWVGPALVLLLLGPWNFVIRLTRPPGTDVSDPAIAFSAFCAVLFWFGGMWLVVASDRPELLPQFRQRRIVWTLGSALFLLHVAVAMHAGHAWSHTKAMDYTQEVSGFGPGIFVSHLFGVVWLVDAVWMWANPDGYRSRPRWVGLCVHGFMAFVVFNGTVVYGRTPLARVVAAMVFVVLLSRLRLRTVRAKPQAAEEGAA